RPPRTCTSVPAVGRAVDAPGVRVVVGRVGRILWRIYTRRPIRRAADVSFARKGTRRGSSCRSETVGPSDGPRQVGTSGTRRNGAPAAGRGPVSGVRGPGVARPAATISIGIMAQLGVAGCALGERRSRGYLASAGGPSHGASVANVGTRGQRGNRRGGLPDADRISDEGGPLVDGRWPPLSCATTARVLENDPVAPCVCR